MTTQCDLRPGTTRRVLDWLRQGRDVTVLAGPLLGKSFLQAQVSAAEANAKLSLAPLESVLTLAAASTLVAAGTKVVPLSTVPRRHLPRDVDDDAWAVTVGHPYLLAGLETGDLEARRKRLANRVSEFEETLPDEFSALRAARTTKEPHACYRILTEEHGLGKAALDRLVRLGLIARAIYGDRAGVEVVPLGAR